MKQLIQVTIFESYFPSEGAPVVFIPVLLHSKFLKTFLYTLHLTFRRRIKSRLPFAGIIRRLTYSTRFQDKG